MSNIRKVTIIIFIFFNLIGCNERELASENGVVGDYLNKSDNTILRILADSTYSKTGELKKLDKKTWYITNNKRITFTNWIDRNGILIDVNEGILRKDVIIFNLDNDFDNYYKCN